MSDANAPRVRLRARHLTRHFTVRASGWRRGARIVHAVDDVSLDLVEGRVTAVVGESGSGKSVLARMLARIVTPTSGSLELDGESIVLGTRRTLDYASRVQLVLQDPFASVNPVHQIRHNLARPLVLHGARADQVEALSREALARVALEPPERFVDRYPHELSGGQLQRVSIARALCAHPAILLADEPISMLDVSVRLGVLNLLRDLCDRERLAILYITHDIASARYIADDVIVMYAGQVVERSVGVDLVDEPRHPYTQLLIASVPDPSAPVGADVAGSDRGATANVAITGCRFRDRCPHAMAICTTQEPPSCEVAPGHFAKCWLYDDRADGAVAPGALTRREEATTR